MLLVILGAGASFDSAPSQHPLDGQSHNLPFRPPLADELFSNREYFGVAMNKFPQCLPVIPRLRDIPSKNSVEIELQALQEEGKKDPVRLRQLAAIKYYLQDILWLCGETWDRDTHSVSNYSALVDTVRHLKQPGEKACFVTFNYDTLLERAFRVNGYPFTELSGYTAKDLMLVKLHGSVNWGRPVHAPRYPSPYADKRILANELIEKYSQLEIGHEYVMVNQVPPSEQNGMPIVPALAIPVQAKLDFECPHQHVDALKAFLPLVTKMVVIGWRGTEQPFLELLNVHLKTTPVKVMVVNGERKHAESTAKNLQKAIPNAKFTVQDGGFTDNMRRRRIAGFMQN